VREAGAKQWGQDKEVVALQLVTSHAGGARDAAGMLLGRGTGRPAGLPPGKMPICGLLDISPAFNGPAWKGPRDEREVTMGLYL